MADVAKIALVLAVVSSVYSAGAFFYGAARGNSRLLTSARNGVLATLGLVTLASLVLVYALVAHRFELAYVASYTRSDMSLPYLLSAFWAGNAGSLLFWAWLLSIFAALMLLRNGGKSRAFMSYASIVVMLTEALFLILMVVVASPFDKLATIPAEGTGLNPLLENPAMVLHPPALLAGYAIMAVPFGLAVAALITMVPDREWLASARRWALGGWLLLGIGNLIGMWWAYVELGWGGYWAWDPVENAGLMPWLVGTAFLHSVAMQRRRGMLRVWSMVLVILAFNLCIFGTFLTRSNILSSVHTFNETGMEPFFLTFLGIALVGSLGLVFYRRRNLTDERGTGSLVSREASFTLANIVLVGGALVVLLGTMWPLISDAVGRGGASLGESFFNRVVGPIFLLTIAILGVCIFLGWRRTDAAAMLRRSLLPLAGALLLCIVLFAVGIREWYALVLFPLLAFVACSHLATWVREVMARGRVRGESLLRAFGGSFMANRAHYGGLIVHLGILLIAAGIIGSSFYQVEREASLSEGDSMSISGYTLTYQGMSVDQGSSKTLVTTTIAVESGGRVVGEVRPQKLFHVSYEQPVTEVAIRSTPVEDLYVILAGWTDEGSTVIFRVLVNPLVMWIWVGAGLLVLGGLVAFWPGESRRS